MYLHLGQEIIVDVKDIVGIYDLDTSTVSKWSREYLSKAEKEGKIINVSYELPKSFVVCKNTKKKEEGEVVYISPLSSQTLLKRATSKKDIIS